MAVLVVAEHDNTEIKPATLNTVTAAGKIGGPSGPDPVCVEAGYIETGQVSRPLGEADSVGVAVERLQSRFQLS